MRKSLTVKETAQILGCSRRQVRYLIHRGHLQAELIRDDYGPTYYMVDWASVRRYAKQPQLCGWPRGKPRKESEA